MKKMLLVAFLLSFNILTAQTYFVSPIVHNPMPFDSGINIGFTQDDVWSEPISIGFDFCFFGKSFNQLLIGENCLVTFDTTKSGDYCNWIILNPIPFFSGSYPNSFIGFPYQDLNCTIGIGKINYKIYGIPPNRKFVLSIDSVPYFGCNSILFSGQMILYEGSNNIEICIPQKVLCTSWNSGCSILGVQDSTENQAFWASNFNYPIQWTAYYQSWLFKPDNIYSIHVTVSPAFDTICLGSSTILTTITDGFPNLFTWAPSTGLNETTTAIVTASPTTTTTYTIVETSSYGCNSTSNAVIFVVSSPQILSAQEEYYIQIGESTTLNISGGNTYSWSPTVGLSASNIAFPIANPTTSTTYTVIGTSIFNCTSSIEVIVNVYGMPEGEDLFIPTGFSPNNDGINDTWEILGSYQYDDIVVSIFNLQGQLIYFQKKKYLPWDGKYQGELVPTGDHYFVIESLSHKRKQTGTLTVKY